MNLKKKNIAVIGLGYVGLPLALLSALRGFKTIGYDIDQSKISSINKNIIPINDYQVNQNFKKALQTKNFIASSNEEDLSETTIFIICVPTPINELREPDLEPIQSALKNISKFLKSGDLISIESTVFPGTCEDVLVPIIENETKLKVGKDVFLAHCPERVNPGDDFWNTGNIPRVVGGISKKCAENAADFYSKLLDSRVFKIEEIRGLLKTKFSVDVDRNFQIKSIMQGAITVMNSIRDAEAVKAMENTVRDVNIALVNELAKISDVLNLDVVDIIDGMSTKPFGKGPFYPGSGVGGHCIAVDPEWLKSASINAGYFPKLIQLARDTNNSMPQYTIDILMKCFSAKSIPTSKAVVAILGVAYKPNVDDARESPFFDIQDGLKKAKIKINVYDPMYTKINTHTNIYDAIKDVDAVIIVTDHYEITSEIKKIDFKETRVSIIIDGRNSLRKTDIDSKILYKGIGR